MRNLKIRRFIKSDIRDVLSIASLVWDRGFYGTFEYKYGRIGDRDWRYWLLRDISNWIKNKAVTTWVSEYNGEIVGFISGGIDREKKIGEVGYNAIHPEYRGKGLGTKQLRFLLNIFRKEGLKFAYVVVCLNRGHLPARKMYKKVGFKEITRSSQCVMPL